MPFKRIKVPSTKTVDAFQDVTCDGCNAELTKGYSASKDYWSHLNPDNCLVLEMIGGYGMALDAIGSQVETTKVFCPVCIQKLCELFPTFKETIDG